MAGIAVATAVLIFIVVYNKTVDQLKDELVATVRHEAAHLAFARTHTAEESAGHSGPSEDFALAFERATPTDDA